MPRKQQQQRRPPVLVLARLGLILVLGVHPLELMLTRLGLMLAPEVWYPGRRCIRRRGQCGAR